MINELLNYLKDKNILILGYGKEGISSYNFIRSNFADKVISIADSKNTLLDEYPYLNKDKYLNINVGNTYLDELEKYDIILKSPGISLKDIEISKFKDKITSQLELFLEYMEVFTIGVTGTKGKSTTSSLIYKILKDQKKDVFLLGNIGEPIFRKINEIKKDSIVVIELSSHALEYVKRSTNIAIILNIYEEHLDYYKSIEKYIEAKFNIVKYQKDDDVFIYNFDNYIINNYNFKHKKNDYLISVIDNKLFEKNNIINKVYLKDEYIYCNNEKIMSINEKIKLKGIHNINNIMFVFAVCNILNLDLNKAKKTIKEFKPLEHRMEYVGRFNGIDFYNDSIATIPEATINSIKSINNVNTIILGGKDRGVDLKNLISFIKNSDINNVICLPKTGEYIYEELKSSKKNLNYTIDLREAVNIAKRVTEKNKVCLLSPAASSYGYFKNFEERGNLYKKFVCE